MNRQFLATSLVSMILTGCGITHGPFGISAQPAPPTYEQWVKPGTTEIEVKKALLECGEPSTVRDTYIYEKALGLKGHDELRNHFFLVDRCMEESGFVVPRTKTTLEYCLWDRHRHLPACQAETSPPKRSVERRMNSWYCKIKTDQEYCRSHSFKPETCGDPNRTFNNPPLECRL
jgi:hypothetical protein